MLDVPQENHPDERKKMRICALKMHKCGSELITCLVPHFFFHCEKTVFSFTILRYLGHFVLATLTPRRLTHNECHPLSPLNYRSLFSHGRYNNDYGSENLSSKHMPLRNCRRRYIVTSIIPFFPFFLQSRKVG